MDRSSMCMRLMMGWVLMMGIISVISIGDAQTVPPCAHQLSPCLDYMNSTNPPDTCCNPLKSIDVTHKICFCQLGFTPGVLEGFGTNTAQALRVLHSCGINFDVSICKASSSALPPSSVQPQATPGGDEGGEERVRFTGLSFMLFFWTFLLFNYESGV
ncbi:non-specific lipid transfer protein GPI-anchored 8-like [Gastrolobium bilobum]|uniref:non-specific lipid transfer protein GPI-anchored 8-like n=1 Tax=Gastrolobium bilobum TaxID=150636 RepID=UPI002AB286C2|nr:non-specific lipid transfer protein GPI-anchored 8-like [Gastrolobium bilobum]